MGKDSKIEWTRHTFNPWWGCTKVDPKCANCYALALSTRYGHDVWGPTASRRQMSDDHWKHPFAWNAAAAKAGERHRVFCASMADVFEGPETCQDTAAYEMIQRERLRLFEIIRTTPNLVWLLLTKRPQNIARFLEEVGDQAAADRLDDYTGSVNPLLAMWIGDWLDGTPPANVWLGTSNERDSQVLASVPAAVHFLSIEPLLSDPGTIDLRGIEWVITGGESGGGARPMHVDWVRSVRDQCIESGVDFFFKQWGEWGLGSQHGGSCEIVINDGRHEKGANLFDQATKNDWNRYVSIMMTRVGKKRAGRIIDGRTWDEIPEVAHV